MAELSNKLKEDISSAIKSSPCWANYENDDMSSYTQKTQETLKTLNIQFEKGNPYQIGNDNIYFVSVDIRSANFTSMKYYHPQLTLGCSSWEELVSKFTDVKFFTAIKIFRQKVFWLVEPTKLNKISNFLISIAAGHIANKVGMEGRKVWINTDELIITCPTNDPQGAKEFSEKISNSLVDCEQLSGIQLRTETYRLRVLSKKKEFIMKEVLRFGEGLDFIVEPEFKSVEPVYYAACFKHYFQLGPVEERDLKEKWNFDSNKYDFIDPNLFLEDSVRFSN